MNARVASLCGCSPEYAVSINQDFSRASAPSIINRSARSRETLVIQSLGPSVNPRHAARGLREFVMPDLGSENSPNWLGSVDSSLGPSTIVSRISRSVSNRRGRSRSIANSTGRRIRPRSVQAGRPKRRPPARAATSDSCARHFPATDSIWPLAGKGWPSAT